MAFKWEKKPWKEKADKWRNNLSKWNGGITQNSDNSNSYGGPPPTLECIKDLNDVIAEEIWPDLDDKFSNFSIDDGQYAENPKLEPQKLAVKIAKVYLNRDLINENNCFCCAQIVAIRVVDSNGNSFYEGNSQNYEFGVPDNFEQGLIESHDKFIVNKNDRYKVTLLYKTRSERCCVA